MLLMRWIIPFLFRTEMSEKAGKRRCSFFSNSQWKMDTASEAMRAEPIVVHLLLGSVIGSSMTLQGSSPSPSPRTGGRWPRAVRMGRCGCG
jgi:hypothetical protein